MGSLSKSFTALAVLQLVEAGRIDLDAPVAAYLPGFTVADRAQARRITVRMLLNQTSGMADAGFPEMTLPQLATIADPGAVGMVAGRPGLRSSAARRLPGGWIMSW